MNRPEGIVALVNGPVLKPFIFLVLLVTVAVLTVGCGSQTKATPVPTAEPALTPTLIPTPEPVVTSTPKPSPTPTATPVPTLTPAPPPTPTATPAPVAFTPAQIFTRVSPSVAFIQTPVGSGSGVLIQDGYVVTNAHVVWPFQEVRIVFSDGTEYLDTPVANWDLMGDLAVLGPIDTTIAPVKLSDGEDLVIGSDLFLIGYPGEGEDFPQPTITRGILSRFRQWEPLEITYFQTDAAIAGGQSGGVLVSVASEVIGISGFELSEARFGVVASAADVLPRVNMLIANRDVAHLGNRRLPLEGGQRDQVFDLRSRWGGQTYVINEPVGTTIEVEVESDNDAAFYIVDALGNLLTSVDETYSGLESGSVTTEIDAPYFLVLGQFSDEEGSFRVRSNQDLLPFQDPDDRTIVSVGETVPASLDRPRDVDNFSIWLSAGQVIQVTVDTVNFDAFGIIAFPGARDDQMAFDDDSGGGVFGTDAKVTYQAPHSGNYFIVVQDANGTKVGGYLVTVSKAPEGAAVSATFPPATATADEGAALPSMLLTLEDLPPGVTLEREGFETDTEYERIFLAVNETFNLGSSRVSGIEIDVELYQSDADAQDVVVIIDGLDPSVFAKVLAGDLAEGDIPGIAGIPEIILMDSLDLPVIGDLGGGLFMKMNATEGEFEGFLLFFAQGNILAGLTATGPAGQIHLEDVVPLAELMAAKVRAQTADPASSINALVIEATEDSYVVADLADDTDPQEFRSQNYGDLEVLKTWYAWGVSEDERLVSVDLVKFDLSELKDLDIESISFQLFAQQADLNQPARLVDVHVVDGQWSEGDVTYESRPPWEIVPVATAPVYGADGWYSWNVTGSVINAVRRGEISFAIALRSATQGSEEQVVFASTEAPGKTPRMLVAYRGLPSTTTAASESEALIVEATEDSYVVTDLADDTDPQGFGRQNYGDLEFLKTWYAWGVVEEERLLSVDLVKFDLEEIQGLDIESVSFQLFARQADLNETARLVDVHNVTGGWSEAEVTYNLRPPWDLVPIATAAIYGGGGWYSWNVTGSVIAAARQGEISFAIALRSATQGSEEQVLFVSTEALDKAPRMLVTYTTPRSGATAGLAPSPEAQERFDAGLAFGEQNKYENAIAEYDQAIELYPEFAEAFNNRGVAYAHLDQLERAIRDYDSAILLNPESANAYSNSCSAYIGLEKHDRAIQDCDDAIQLDSDFSDAYTNRGTAYFNLGQDTLAIKDLDDAIRLDPQLGVAYAGRAFAYTMLGNAAAAQADIDRAVELGVDRNSLETDVENLKLER